MAKENKIEETKVEVPSTVFEIEKVGKFKFNVAKFVLPGFEEGKVILSKDALKDPKILAELVNIEAGIITKIE